jgi:hypothetical protein
MQRAYRVHSQLSADGTLALEGLPFQAGDEVEVIVIFKARTAHMERRYPLRGKPLIYESPFDSIAESDW